MLAAFIFTFGAVIGSFLNAVLWRLHSGASIVHGRSQCPSCGHALGVRDLVPILSWLSLRGRCRYCAKGIGASYVIIELVTGAALVLAAHTVLSAAPATGTMLAQLLLYWYALATLIVVFVFDLRHMLILRVVTTPAIILLALGNLALGMSPYSVALGMAFGAGFFWLQFALSKGKWIGGGDIHLGALMGALLGWPMTLAAVFLAYMVGAVYGIAALSVGRARMKSEIPFGTFLSIAAAVMLLWGHRILGWYMGLLV